VAAGTVPMSHASTVDKCVGRGVLLRTDVVELWEGRSNAEPWVRMAA